MDRRIVDRVESWESRPIQGGFSGLQSLVDEDFSGAVSAAGTWLFMLNGRGVGVFGGSLDDLSGSEATAYDAPDASLPLLFAMQESGGETYATYYTNDTPLSEVDDTLTDANFTGYIELSENVLSGDYYVVYYGGRSMSAAFVGSSERLITGDEAYEKAADEVGIYEVTKVDLDLVDIPEPDQSDAPDDSTAAAAFDEPALDADGPSDADADIEESPIEEAEAGVGGSADSSDLGVGGIEDLSDQATDETEEGTDGVSAGGLAETIESAEAARGGQSPEPSDDGSQTQTHADTDPDTGDAATDEPTVTDAEAPDAPRSEQEPPVEPSSESTPSTPDGSDPGTQDQAPAEAEPASGGHEPPSQPEDDPFSEEEQWRETRTIPALNPEESESNAATEEAPSRSRTGQPEANSRPSTETAPSSAQAPDRGPPEASASTAEQATPSQPADQRQQLEKLNAALKEREQEIETLRGRHEEANAEIESLREERDELRSRIEELENAVAGADSGGANAGPSQSLDRQTALEQTDLFVRYGSKGEGTLEKAHSGQATRDEVGENLRLEHHTRFEEDDVAVDGRPFTAFLEDTIEYRFIEWLVEDLLWEIQGTGSRGKLKDLYDALPAIDRAEFRGVVSTRDEDGEERRQEFDVIVRDRMGQPLVVANINDRRDPATGGMMEDLVEASMEVAEDLDTLGAAFQVTASFFKPEALETASGATGSGLLSRDKRQSFVKLSRKRGFHLCLVESRGDDFHVTVPEL